MKKDEISKKIAGVLEKFPAENMKFFFSPNEAEKPKEKEIEIKPVSE